MAISNLETIIENIEQLIENVHADNRGRILLPKDNLRQLLGELKSAVPIEIKRFSEKTRELEKNKSKALEEARNNAERIMQEANAMKDRLLDENEQVKLAEEKANKVLSDATLRGNEILKQAEENAMNIQERALKEYDDSLIYILNYIQNMGNTTQEIMNMQLNNLREKMNEVLDIRRNLHQSLMNRQEKNDAMNNMGNVNDINNRNWG